MKKINLSGVAISQYPRDAIERLKELDKIHSLRMEQMLEDGAMYTSLNAEYDRKQKEYSDLYELC